VQAQVKVLKLAIFHNLKRWARMLLRDVHAVYLAAHDPRVPWYAKILAAAVAGYALSPIDLIPDFIPVLGYADDLIIVPLGIWLAVSLVPQEVMAEYRIKADEAGQRPRSTIAAIAIIAIWIFTLLALSWVALSWAVFVHWSH
jgi:uncharacterized membrane protein YkvA (DUF1232 family)